MTATEICVIGGGPAGLAVAAAAARRGRSVLVVERSRYDAPRYGEHLPPNGVAALLALGVPAAALQEHARHFPCIGLCARWSGEEQRHDYLFHPLGAGLNLSRPAFDQDVADHVAGLGATILTGARVDAAQWADANWRLRVMIDGEDAPRAITARHVVDASGRTASFAKRCGVGVNAYDRQAAVITVYHPPEDAAARAEHLARRSHMVSIDATPRGWWSVTPMAEGGAVAAFYTDADLWSSRTEDTPTIWAAALAEAPWIAAHLDGLHPAGPPVLRSARSQALSGFGGPGWTAVGDAAMTFDPLSGQGVTKGVRQGVALGEALDAALSGDAAALDALLADWTTAHRQYLTDRRDYYRLERRWPDAPFWRRRQAETPQCLPARVSA